jgi:hypothetical protein
MKRETLIGGLCFLLGAISLALAQTTAMRPDQFVAAAWTWTGTQSSTPQTLTISGSTFTPAATAGNNVKFTLVHASCPCTVANPSGTVTPGTSGVMEVTQSATGTDTIGTWGSSYIAAGGTSTLTLSTAAGATDTLSYYVRDATHIVLTMGALNATH